MDNQGSRMVFVKGLLELSRCLVVNKLLTSGFDVCHLSLVLMILIDNRGSSMVRNVWHLLVKRFYRGTTFTLVTYFKRQILLHPRLSKTGKVWSENFRPSRGIRSTSGMKVSALDHRGGQLFDSLFPTVLAHEMECSPYLTKDHHAHNQWFVMVDCTSY